MTDNSASLEWIAREIAHVCDVPTVLVTLTGVLTSMWTRTQKHADDRDRGIRFEIPGEQGTRWWTHVDCSVTGYVIQRWHEVGVFLVAGRVEVPRR